jgi:hypothetical protein
MNWLVGIYKRVLRESLGGVILALGIFGRSWGYHPTDQAGCLKCTTRKGADGYHTYLKRFHVKQEVYCNCKSVDHPVLSALLYGGWKPNMTLKPNGLCQPTRLEPEQPHLFLHQIPTHPLPQSIPHPHNLTS